MFYLSLNNFIGIQIFHLSLTLIGVRMHTAKDRFCHKHTPIIVRNCIKPILHRKAGMCNYNFMTKWGIVNKILLLID